MFFDVIREGNVITSVRVNVFKPAKSIAFRGHSLPIVRAMVRWVIWLRQTIALDAKSHAVAQEPSAPQTGDRKMMGSTMQWYAFPRADAGTFPRPEELPWAMKVDKDYFIDRSSWAWWWETGLEIDNATEAELVRDNFLRAVFGNWAYLKNYVPKYANYRLDYLQHIAMKTRVTPFVR